MGKGELNIPHKSRKKDFCFKGASQSICMEENSFILLEVLVAQSCPALSYRMDCSSTGSSLDGTSQTRVLGWIAISSSRDLPHPGIKPGSPALQAGSLPSVLDPL